MVLARSSSVLSAGSALRRSIMLMTNFRQKRDDLSTQRCDCGSDFVMELPHGTHSNFEKPIVRLKVVYNGPKDCIFVKDNCAFAVNASSAMDMKLIGTLDGCQVCWQEEGAISMHACREVLLVWRTDSCVHVVMEPKHVSLSGEKVIFGRLPDSDVHRCLTGCIQKLNSRVAQRALKVVEPIDIELVRYIGLCIQKLMSLPDWENIAADWRLDRQPHVMSRLYLPSGDDVEVRVHLFENVEETFIHNHKANFASHCLGGGYDHIVWQVVRAANQYHYEFARSEDGRLISKGRKHGELRAELQHTYLAGASYFLSAHAFHTVRPIDDQSPVLTVYVVGKPINADRRVLALKDRQEWRVPNDPECDLGGNDRLRVLREMQSIVVNRRSS